MAGLNSIRVWGGGVAERTDFYNICDELGLLVYQEFFMTGDNNGRWAGSYDWPENKLGNCLGNCLLCIIIIIICIIILQLNKQQLLLLLFTTQLLLLSLLLVLLVLLLLFVVL